MDSWITQVVQAMGLWGIAALMFLENVFPPVPSELIMPLAGYLSTRGGMSFWGAVGAGSVGSLAGATFWYVLGRVYSGARFRELVRRHGVWLAMDVEDFDKAREWFDRHGGKAVFFGRMVPAVRTLISVPAGLSGMPLTPFLLWSALGTALWTLLLAWCGRLVGSQFDRIGEWIDPVSYVVLTLMIAWYVWGVARALRKRRKR